MTPASKIENTSLQKKMQVSEIPYYCNTEDTHV